MQLFVPKPRDPGLPVFYNVDTSVGQNGQNASQEDIQLVQFLILKTAERPLGIPNTQRGRMLKVKPDGRVGPLTIDGIRAVQELMKTKRPATVVDGRVSSARGVEYGGGAEWTIASMNAAMRRRYKESWPRLHDVAGCPGALRMAIERCL